MVERYKVIQGMIKYIGRIISPLKKRDLEQIQQVIKGFAVKRYGGIRDDDHKHGQFNRGLYKFLGEGLF